MKALTLHQPWASLVAVGVKTIETRSWSTGYRGPLAIHAAKTAPLDGEEVGEWWWTWDVDHGIIVRQPSDANRSWREHSAPLGAVVATCDLIDVVPFEVLGFWASPTTPQVTVTDEGPPCWLVDTHQCLYGDFSPGRYAWLLGGIEPMDEPIPARGRRGLWNWNEGKPA